MAQPARRRKNRTVKPYRGQLYNMVLKNFAEVPFKDANGRFVEDSKGKKKKMRRPEVCDAFDIYYNLCLLDEFFKSLYEQQIEGKREESNLSKTFGRSWKYLLRRFASQAPRGIRQLCVKLESRLEDVDNLLNDHLDDLKSDKKQFSDVIQELRKEVGNTQYRQTVEWYADFIKQAFAMLGMNVTYEYKNNPRFGIKYFSFSEGDDMSALISRSSSMLAEELAKTAKLKDLRDAKLKSSLLDQGLIVESSPVFVDDDASGTKGKAIVIIGYDPKIASFPKPGSKPNPPKFTKAQYNLIVNLENLVDEHTVYPGIDPKPFFDLPKYDVLREAGESILVLKDGEEEKNNRIIREITQSKARAERLSVPEYQPGWGLNPDGTPESGRYHQRGAMAGKPYIKYVIPKRTLDKYMQASRVFEKLLTLRNYHEKVDEYYQSLARYKEDIKPYVRGVYHSDFTDDTGLSYQRFDDVKDLAKRVINRRQKEATAQAIVPKIKEVRVEVDNYPVWDQQAKKIVYQKKKITATEIVYPDGRKYNPTMNLDVLNDARAKIVQGTLKPYFKEIKDGDGTTGISKTLQVARVKGKDGEDMEIVVQGRYSGLTLSTIMNMEGKFLEEGYYTRSQNGVSIKNRIDIDAEGNVSTVIRTYDEKKDKWINDQRLIEPYITLNPITKKLILGIPGGSTNTADRNLMKQLTEKISSIKKELDPKLEGAAKLNPFFTFAPEDFEIIRDTLGSVAMSAAASKFMDAYYEKLRAKESATTEESIERFTPEALGGFVKETSRGAFQFNNKQREAASWLEASGMQGVVALDTGVGKTLTSLVAIKSAINQELEEGAPERRFLYISPISLVGNLKDTVRQFMVEGGDFERLDGTKEKMPNWKEIVLKRIDEMSYEDFVGKFSKAMNTNQKMFEQGEGLTEELDLAIRSLKYKGKSVVVTYEVCYDHDQKKELWRNQIKVVPGKLTEEGVIRTASKKTGREIQTIQVQEDYPTLTESEEKAAKKERARLRREVRKLKESVEKVSAPEANKLFEDKYYACFFDEINEIFGTKPDAKKKNLAVSSLTHPRKVFLTASALDRDPVDLYRLSTLAKGQVPTPKSEKAFAEKYGNVLAGRMVALKPNPEIREQFYNWVKENAYFAPKMDISQDEMGVNYADVNLPVLQPLKTRTITTRMPRNIQKEYRVEAKKIAKELEIMLKKYRDLRGNLATQEETDEFINPEKKHLKNPDRRVYQDLTRATGKVAKSLAVLMAKSSGSFKVKPAVNVFKENTKARLLYFCSTKDLAVEVVTANSLVRPDMIHAICWKSFIHFYRNGKVIAKVTSRSNVSVDQFAEKHLKKNLWSELRTANDEGDDGNEEATWAMDISKKFIKENGSLATVICSDNYARGFNFQTFTKVVHLDRGPGFDSEILKQRTARAYRGGQADQVEEIFIDATLTPSGVSEGSVSEDALTKDGKLEEAVSFSRQELKDGVKYTTWAWDQNEWVNMMDWSYDEAENDPFVMDLFTDMGYVKPVEIEGESHRRIVLPKGMNPKDAAKVPRDFASVSLDQIKSIVNQADQEFFQDIIVNGLKSDLTRRLDARISDTGVAVVTPMALMRTMINPTPDNIVKLNEELKAFDDNPLSNIRHDPSRYDNAADWLTPDRIETNMTIQGELTDQQKNLLDLVGGPNLDYDLSNSNGAVRLNHIPAEPWDGGDPEYIEAKVRNTKFVDVISRHYLPGENVIKNDVFYLKACAPRGYGSKTLLSEIVSAKRMGVRAIKTIGAQSGGDVGYLVWPRFGFDGVVDLREINEELYSDDYVIYDAVVQAFDGQTKVSILDLLSITADLKIDGQEDQSGVAIGELLWTKYGKDIDLEFDLSDNSRSMKIANSFMKRKALEANLSVEDFLNSDPDLFDVSQPGCWPQEMTKCVVDGVLLDWVDVVRMYPDAFKSAWYSHPSLRKQVRDLLGGSEAKYQGFMRKFNLKDPKTTGRDPRLMGRDRVRPQELPRNTQVTNVRSASPKLDSNKFYEEVNDPCLLAVWEELRLKNYAGQIAVNLMEAEDDPDIIEIQTARKAGKK